MRSLAPGRWQKGIGAEVVDSPQCDGRSSEEGGATEVDLGAKSV